MLNTFFPKVVPFAR